MLKIQFLWDQYGRKFHTHTRIHVQQYQTIVLAAMPLAQPSLYIYIDIRLTIFWYALHAKPECRRKARGSSGICASCVFLKILSKNNRLKPLGRRDNRGIRNVTCCSILPIVPAVPSDVRSTSTALTRRQADTSDDDDGDDEQIDCGGVG